jgi:hypothetical protein
MVTQKPLRTQKSIKWNGVLFRNTSKLKKFAEEMFGLANLQLLSATDSMQKEAQKMPQWYTLDCRFFLIIQRKKQHPSKLRKHKPATV